MEHVSIDQVPFPQNSSRIVQDYIMSDNGASFSTNQVHVEYPHVFRTYESLVTNSKPVWVRFHGVMSSFFTYGQFSKSQPEGHIQKLLIDPNRLIEDVDYKTILKSYRTNTIAYIENSPGLRTNPVGLIKMSIIEEKAKMIKNGEQMDKKREENVRVFVTSDPDASEVKSQFVISKSIRDRKVRMQIHSNARRLSENGLYTGLDIEGSKSTYRLMKKLSPEMPLDLSRFVVSSLEPEVDASKPVALMELAPVFNVCAHLLLLVGVILMLEVLFDRKVFKWMKKQRALHKMNNRRKRIFWKGTSKVRPFTG